MDGKLGKILVVLAMILATKVLFNWMDRKLVEDCVARGGQYQTEGIGEGCYGAG